MQRSSDPAGAVAGSREPPWLDSLRAPIDSTQRGLDLKKEQNPYHSAIYCCNIPGTPEVESTEGHERPC